MRRGGRANKNQGPKRVDDPVKRSVRMISQDADITDTVLEAYRMKQATSGK